MDNLGDGAYICTRCKGQDLVFDATAVFNKRTGKFEMMDVLDGVWCNTCSERTRDEWVEPHYLQE